ERIGLEVARVAGGVFDESDGPIAIAAEARQVCEQAQRRRKARECVVVQPDRQAGVLACRRECKRTRVLVVGAARGAEAAEKTSLDGGGVACEKAESCAGLEMRVRVSRMVAQSLPAQNQRAVNVRTKRRVERRINGRADETGARLPEIVVDGDRSLLE